MSDRVLCTVEGGVADVRLNRPDKFNAVDDEMFVAIADTIVALRRQEDLRVVVLSGNGRGFCGGLDLGAIRNMADGKAFRPADADAVRDPEAWSETERAMARGQRVALGWRGIPVPVLVAVHGAAMGAGLQIAMGGDVLVVHPDAKLGLAEMRWGFTPDMSGTQILPRLVGRGPAAEMIFAARPVTGTRALEIGLATAVSDDPLAYAMELGADIAKANPEAVRMCKRLLDLSETAPLEEGLAMERHSMKTIVGTPGQRAVAEAALAARG